MSDVTVACIAAIASFISALVSAGATWRAAAIGRHGAEAAANIGRRGTEAAAQISKSASDAAAHVEATGSRIAAEVAAAAEIATNDKSIFVGSVTSERAIWRREVRIAATSAVSLLRSSGSGDKINWLDIYVACSDISLRLNPVTRQPLNVGQGEHLNDRAVQVAVDNILLSPRRDRREHVRLAMALEIAVQKVLKQEWQVSKKEAKTGTLAGTEMLAALPQAK